MTRPLLVFGRRPVLEALAAGRAREVLLAPARRDDGRAREILETAERRGVAVRRVPAERIAHLADEVAHQGVAAEVAPPPLLSERELAVRSWGERAVVVVLDGVMDPRNVGAIARTAEAAGAEALVVRRRRGAGLGPAAMKASAGALLHLPLAEVHNIARALARLKDAGFWIVGLAADAPRPLARASEGRDRVAFVLGSEEEGLSRLVGDSCDALASIPLRGRVGSLNVSVAAAVALFARVAAEAEG